MMPPGTTSVYKGLY